MLLLLRAFAAIGGLILLSTVSLGAESHAMGGVVLLNSVPVLRFKASSPGGSPVQQAILTAKRLKMVDDDAEVKAVGAGRNYEIQVGGATAVVITPEESTLHGVRLTRLAEDWASTIRDALSLPPLKFSEDFLRLPVNSTKEVGLVGRLALSAAVISTNESVIHVRKADRGLTIQCVSIGDCQIRAVSGSSARSLDVSVRPSAGTFPQSFEVDVTGSPAPESMVRGALEGCVKSRTVCLPGAVCTFVPIPVDALAKGKSATYALWARLRAKDAFDAAGNVTVTVRNLDLGPAEETALWYSNAPESVQQVGSLFASFLKKNAPVRFLYHHIDASTQPIIVRVEAVNDTDQAASVLVVPGDTRPDKNPVRAGMTAGVEFLKYWQFQSGEVVELPAHSTFPVSIRRLSPNETMSGLCSLRLVSGPPEVLIRTDALPAFDLVGAWYDASLSSTPWREAGSHPINDYDRASYEPSLHIYPDPYKLERLDYFVGGRSGFLLFGQRPIAGEDHTSYLDGNFGVIYKIEAVIKNPTGSAADVDLVFEASAGYMGGIFLVDGTLIQTRLMSPKEESRLGRYHLPPGGTRTIELVTFPVSGGSYPATLFLRPADK